MGAAKAEVIRWGPERARARPWNGDRHVAHLTPFPGASPPSPTFVRRAVDDLAARGYRRVLTPALSSNEQSPFLQVGFEVHERLHLLSRDLRARVPRGAGVELARARARDRPSVLYVDNRAFPPFWRLDEPGLDDALLATPHGRFRVARRHGEVAGYAITGRAGRRGYLQRLAVDPDHQRQGLARALALDGLRWLRRWRVESAVVNTPLGNEAGLALYRSLGFHEEPVGLSVLSLRLEP